MRLFFNKHHSSVSKSKKRPKISLTLIVVAFVAVTLAGPFLSNDQASAVNASSSQKLNDPNYLNWQVQSNWYLQAVASCTRDPGWRINRANAGWNLNQADVKSGNWLSTTVFGDDGRDGTVGYYMRDTLSDIGDDGKMSCASNNNELIKKAMNFWGIDPQAALCESGVIERNNGTDCASGNGDFKLRGNALQTAQDLLRKYVIDKVYGGKAPNLTDAMQYVVYKRTLLMGCAASSQQSYATKPGGAQVYEIARISKGPPPGFVGPPSPDQQNQVNVTSEYYIGDKGPNEQRWLWPSPDTSKTCQQLADAIKPGTNYANGYLAYISENNLDPNGVINGGGGNSQQPGSDGKTSCAPEGIGWILCPISNAIAGMTDGLFGIVSSLMKVKPILGGGAEQQNLFNAWSTMRNIANVAFVITFLIIIFSQLTSFGVSNYGIKKMLPRLVIAAILVNISFYLCAIFVDISNILGVSIQDLLTSLRASSSVGSAPDLWSNLTAAVLSGGAIAGVSVAWILLNPGTIWAAVGALVLFMLPALFAIMVAFIVLVLRQALIIILIIIAPLAFVAYILPNTEQWYKRWQSTLLTLLFLFPMMSVVFGGSQLAASFIMGSADKSNTLGLVMYIGGLAVQVIPLFITPLLIKLSSGVLNRFAGIINNPNRGPIDRAKKGIQKEVDNQRTLTRGRQIATGKGFGARVTRWGARRQSIRGANESNLKGATTDYIAEAAAAKGASGEIGDNKFAESLSGGNKTIQNAVVASALAQQEKALKEEVSDMEALVRVKFDKPEKALEEALKKGDGVQAMAAQNLLYAQGSGGINTFHKTVEGYQADGNNPPVSPEALKQLTQNTLTVHGQTTKAKDKAILDWAKNGGASMQAATRNPETYNEMASEDLIGQTGEALRNAVRSGGVSEEKAKEILADKQLSRRLDNEQRAALESAADLKGAGYEKAHEQAMNQEISQAWDEAHDIEIRRAQDAMNEANRQRDAEARRNNQGR